MAQWYHRARDSRPLFDDEALSCELEPPLLAEEEEPKLLPEEPLDALPEPPGCATAGLPPASTSASSAENVTSDTVLVAGNQTRPPVRSSSGSAARRARRRSWPSLDRSMRPTDLQPDAGCSSPREASGVELAHGQRIRPVSEFEQLEKTTQGPHHRKKANRR